MCAVCVSLHTITPSTQGRRQPTLVVGARQDNVFAESTNIYYIRATYGLFGESMEIRDLETRGPWAVREDATKGPRVSKSQDHPITD